MQKTTVLKHQGAAFGVLRFAFGFQPWAFAFCIDRISDNQ
jgi:hypothetical protein